MRGFDFSSWQGAATTILGLLVFALVGVGIRILMMMTLQARQQRMNRQINERLRTLIAAYKVLGGSFTGSLTVDPSHMRELKERIASGEISESMAGEGTIGERARRIRDAVEAALADIVLLGTEDQVRMAARAAQDMAEGRPIETGALVISLRNFIREALDLEAIPTSLVIPLQGPTRPSSSGGKGGAGARDGRSGGGGGGGGGEGGGGGMGGGMGMGMGLGMGRREEGGS